MPIGKRVIKFFVVVFGVLLLGVVLFFTGRIILYTQIRKNIEERLTDLNKDGIAIKYDYLKTYVWSGKIEFYQLEIKVGIDSDNPGVHAQIPYFLIKGVEIIPFIKNKTLAIRNIALQEPSIVYVPTSRMFKSDSTNERKLELHGISLANLNAPKTRLFIKDSVGRDTVVVLEVDLRAEELGMARKRDSLELERANITLTNLGLKLPKDLYKASVKRVQFGLRRKSVDIDTIQFEPLYKRVTFMNKIGKQTDMMIGKVPYIRINGFDWKTYPRKKLTITSISTSFTIDMFRDKRYPFKKERTSTLPSHFLHRLPFEVRIDTIRLKPSYLSYAEYPEKGDSSGSVFFDRLTATIYAIHNNPSVKEKTVMNAEAKFMGAGHLAVKATFPYQLNQPYTVSGSLSNMPLEKLNRMLGAAAKVRIESGTMSKLKFDFSYGLEKSVGEVELNYENLRIATLRQNSKQEQAVSMIKTLLLNTFIIKKDMTDDMPADKRTGSIQHDRDPYRSVFNYWWKSVFTGIKSAYKLDKLEQRMEKASQRKEHSKKDIKQVFSNIF